MSDENAIEPNEELDCYIGMKLNDVENDLTDKGINYRTIAGRGVYCGVHGKDLDRVNVRYNEFNIVIELYYG